MVIFELEPRPSESGQSKAEQLPPEIWSIVYANLSFYDLLQMRLVCKQLKRWVSHSMLRKRGKLVIRCEKNNQFGQLSQLKDWLLFSDTLEFHDMGSHMDSFKELYLVEWKEIHHLFLFDTQPSTKLPILFPNLVELFINTIYPLPDGFDINKLVHLKQLTLKSVGHPKSDILRQLSDGTKLQLEELHIQHDFDNEEFELLTVLMTHAKTLRHIEIGLFGFIPVRRVKQWAIVFQEMNQLETIQLYGLFLKAALFAIFTNLPDTSRLKHIDLSGLAHLNDELMSLILSKWHDSLRKLVLMHCGHVCKTFATFLNAYGKLQYLNLDNCCKITGNFLIENLVHERNDQLKELHLNDVPLLDESSLCILVPRLTALVSLDLGSCHGAVTSKSLKVIFRTATQLRHLTLDNCRGVTNDTLLGNGELKDSIQNLSRLQSLSLRYCFLISNRGLSALTHKHLQSLAISRCEDISSKGIKKLIENCPTIEDLDLCNCSRLNDDSILNIVCGLKRLRVLDVRNCSKLTIDSFNNIVQYSHSLKTLIFDDTRWKDPAIVCHFERKCVY